MPQKDHYHGYNINNNVSTTVASWEYNVNNQQTYSFNGSVYGVIDVNVTTTLDPGQQSSNTLKFINLLIPPILVVFGVTFNCLTILTMRTRFFRKVSTSVYLKVGAINDAIALMVSLVAHWLYVNFPNVYIRTEYSHFMCKFFNFYGSWNNDFGIIVTVSMTAERALVIASPFGAAKYCSVSRAWKVVLIMFMLIVLKNCHYLAASDIVPEGRTDRLCDVFVDNFGISYKTFYEEFWPWFHLFYVVSCGIVIIISNCIILHNVRKSFAVNSGKRNAWRHFGPMLLGESLLLVIFTFPFTFHLALLSIRLKYDPNLYNDAETAEVENLVFSITFYMLYSNKCVNFFMYCITGKQFRDGLVVVLLKCACREVKHRFRDRTSTFRSTSSSMASSRSRTSTVKSNSSTRSSIFKRSSTLSNKHMSKFSKKPTSDVSKRQRTIVSRIQSKRSCTSGTIISKTSDKSCQVLPETVSKETQTQTWYTDTSLPNSQITMSNEPSVPEQLDTISLNGRRLTVDSLMCYRGFDKSMTNHKICKCSDLFQAQTSDPLKCVIERPMSSRYFTNRDATQCAKSHDCHPYGKGDCNQSENTRTDTSVYMYVERYVTNFDLDVIEKTYEHFSMYL